MRLLRTLAPLVVIVGLVTACGSSSSSSSGAADPTSPPATAGGTSGLEVRPVYARYTSGVSLGPSVPQALKTVLSNQKCPAQPQIVQSMLLECDAGQTVYLMQAPIVSGGVASATAKQIGHKDLWFVQLTLDPATTTALATGVQSLSGTELAYSFGGQVLVSVIVDSSYDTGKLDIVGSYDKAQATRLASRLSAS